MILVVIGFGALTGYYWWQIRAGRGAVFQEKFRQGFSLAPGLSPDRGGAADNVRFEGGGEPSLGRLSAPITVVEFLDFKCPNCLASAPILKRLIATYGQDVNLIVRDFPVETTHPGATELAILAYCAHRQGRYWPVHDILFENQATIGNLVTPELTAELAARAQLDSAELNKCRTSAAARQKVDQDYFDGISLGVRGTPTFFINRRKVEGTVAWAGWEALVKSVPSP